MASDDPTGPSLPKNQIELETPISKSHDEDTKKRRESNSQVKWVLECIEMRKCSYYISSTKTKSDGQVRSSMCQCGYRKEDHDEDAINHPKQEKPQQDLKWDFEQHTAIVPTNAFGEIEFVDCIGSNAKFLRVDSKTEMDRLETLLKYVWKIENPNLIISVIGGEENFNMTPHLRDMFRFGLVNAAQKTDAWIITGGTHAGVAKYIGEAVQYSRLNSKNEKDIVAIGIAPWGVIQNRHLLEYIQSEPIQYAIEDKPIENERFLNPNHSHFILVDNGTQHQFGTETTLRAELEFMFITFIFFDHDKRIPTVLLVIDGGPNILKRVRNALSTDIPVVIVKGSGRVADLLAYAFEHAEESEFIDTDNKGNDIMKKKKSLKDNQKSYISKQMKNTKFCEMTAISDNIEDIEACLDKFKLINIFELGCGCQDLYNTMCNAVLTAIESDSVKQLKIALKLKLFDIARSDILTADKRWKPGSLEEIMMSEILLHNVDTVELLLDAGVNIKTFLTTKRLIDLYIEVDSKKNSFSDLFKQMRVKIKQRADVALYMKTVGKKITYLLDDYYLQQYSSYPEGNDEPENAPFENPFLHLLIWAVLNNLQDMAKLFWRKGLDSIAAALLAHALLSAMASLMKNANPDLYDDIEANSREFMDLATGVVERCFRINKSYAQDILTVDLLQWEKASCVLIAIKTNDKSFISATACQDVFNTVWMGEMTQDNSILKLLICMLIPPLIPRCVNFTQSVQESVQEMNRKIMECQRDQDEESSSLQPYESYETKYFERAKEKIPLFYRAPVICFLSHVISYMAFLCLYSYALITKFGQQFSVDEVVLIVWVVNIFIEEIRQVIATRYIYNEIKLKAYLTDLWNIADILMILLFVIGIILKHLSCQGTLEAARVVLGVNLIICFLRLLQMFSSNKELGPKLAMIIRMVRNLTSFFVILLIFIVAYAIASHAILYPDTEISFNVLSDIFRRPYWNIYGELMLDEIEGNNDCTNIVELYRNGTQPRCPTEFGKYVVPVLMGVYMLMCNILLLNLLISIFSNTFQMVQENADKHWRIQRYYQIQEYITRSMFVPPISFIEVVIKSIVFLKRYRCQCKAGKRSSRTNVFLQTLDDEDYRDTIRKWERTIAQDFINSKRADLKGFDHSVQARTPRLDQLVSKIEALEEQQHVLTATIENFRLHLSQVDCVAKSGSSNVDEPGSVALDQRMDNIEKKIPWIDDILEEHQPKAEQASPEKTNERVEGNKKADVKRSDQSVKALTLRVDHLVSKIKALEEQQHVLTATIENARLHPSQFDCVAKSGSSIVDEPSSVTSDQRMDNIEKKLQWIVNRLKEYQPGAEQASP